MKSSIRFTSRANLDVRDHLDWQSANVSAKSAETLIQQLLRQTDIIAEDPFRWPLARESQRLELDLHESHVSIRGRKTHRILFTVIAEAVVVVAVRHVARDELSDGNVTD